MLSILIIKMLTCPNELVPDLDFLTSNNEVPFDFLEFIVLFFSSATQNEMLKNLECNVLPSSNHAVLFVVNFV